jgi:hypothetical protein
VLSPLPHYVCPRSSSRSSRRRILPTLVLGSSSRK